MAERVAPVDAAVDELRRKARRRLVGAIVLALAAAVILPMLLEKEPRPLGEDVAVRIPPVDEGKFVNRLSPPEATKAPVAPAAPASTGTAEVRIGQPAAESPPKPAADPAPAPAAPKPAVAAAPATADAAPVSTQEVKPEVPSEPLTRSDPRPTSVLPSKDAEGFVVQLAAFSDDKGANALAAKLKRNGYPAYTETIQTSRGMLYRVRVGGYATREAAGTARNRLKGDGYAGIVAPAR